MVFDVQQHRHRLGEEQEAEFAQLFDHEALDVLADRSSLDHAARTDAGHEARQRVIVRDRVPYGLRVGGKVERGGSFETSANAADVHFHTVGHR